ncbi:zinc finger MYM-type protein 1-like [Dysidea avara]|uniref:zinc finger MYM-type protein 1-like n=1 Tax=Dysidea avara TaxID=196820 RepID=UPI00331B0C7C
MSAVKQLSLFNFVKQKCTAKQAKATEDPGPSSKEESQLIIDISEDTSKVTNQESEQYQLINLREDPKVEGEFYNDDGIDDEIYAALVKTSKSPSPCCTPVMVYSSDDDEETSFATRFSPQFSPGPDEVDGMSMKVPQSHHAITCSSAALDKSFSIGTATSSTSQLFGDYRGPNNDTSSTAATGSTTEVCSASSLACTTTLEFSSCLPKDIAETIAFPPVQPVKAKYPSTMISKVPRCFTAAWYKQYEWLEYSVETDACYCYPCRLLGAQSVMGKSRPEQVFTLSGFKDWKHATGKKGALVGHSNSLSHKEAMVAWEQYKINSKRGTLLPNQVDNSWDVVIQENKHYIKTIAEVLLLCSRQNISIRGHREGIESSNRGNFLEMFELIAKHDPVVRKRMAITKSAKYTSPMIQNEILGCMGDIVQAKICADVKKAGMYSILADEARDCSKVEQLAIILRYVDLGSATVHERFLTYVEARCQNAESLAAHIISTLNEHKLDTSAIVSQGYDGASVMSGCCTGVQQRIKQVAPQAVYVHCYAHCLNLVLVDTTKIVSEASEFFALMETLYVFMSTNKVHTLYIEQQHHLYPNKPPRQLQKLSDTRCACRFLAVDAVCSTFRAILATLQKVVDSDDKVKVVEAKGILLQVHCFKFLTTLVTFSRLLFLTKQLSDQLQSSQTDMAKAAELVEGTMKTLQQFRSDGEWRKLYKYVSDVASSLNIEVSPLNSRPQRSQRLPKRLEHGVILQSVGSRQPVESHEEYKISLYYPVIDAMMSELYKRFEGNNLALMKAIQCCSPESVHFLDIDHLAPLIEGYNLSKDLLTAECLVAKHTLDEKDLTSISDVLKEIYPLKVAFPTLVKLLQISLTIVVSTAECERSFSCLKRTKSFLRSTMSEERLNNLATLSIERDLSAIISMDEVIQKFAGKDKNRKIKLS